jgi:hypothetical protein
MAQRAIDRTIIDNRERISCVSSWIIDKPVAPTGWMTATLGRR